VVQHIRKELTEIEAQPTDLSEWIDVAILALDGAWRAGHSPEDIIAALVAKQAKNEARAWPDWRERSEDVAIEHDRTSEAPAEAFTAEQWPRVIIERDGLRLQQSQPPNSFLEVVRIADGKEIVSQPCVVHDDRSELIMLLFAAYARLVRERHTRKG
jgi:hypothetical protein